MRVLRIPAVSAHAFRQGRRAAVIWGIVFGTFVWVSAYGFATAYPKASDRLDFARTMIANEGIRAIFGPGRGLDTVEGFTAWRSSTLFAVIGAIWGLLLVTKVLRGDEEDGRAELIYAGPVTRTSGLRDMLAGIGAVALVLFVTVAMGVVAVGEFGGYYSATAGLFYALVICAPAAMFMAVGAFTSQLTTTRRAASGLAGTAVGAALVFRAIGESTPDARWVLWLSPFSWVDRMHPLTGTAWGPFLPTVGLVAIAVVGALALATRRDIGGATFAGRDTAQPRTALLSSPIGLAVRLVRGTVAAWALGLAVMAAIFGVASSSISDALGSNEAVSDIFARMGSELSARGYVGLTFVMMSAAVAFAAASFAIATRREESDGRVEVMAAAPMRVGTWLVGRAAVAAIALVVIAVTAGVGGWIGARGSGGGIALATMLAAGLNIVAPGLVTLGIATCAHGLTPRLTAPVAYGGVAWGFLIEMVGSVVDLPSLLLDTSLLHHVAAAPLVSPRWDAAVVMSGIGVAATVAGALAFERRDLALG